MFVSDMSSEQTDNADQDLEQLEDSLRIARQQREANPNDTRAALGLCDLLEQLSYGYLRCRKSDDDERAEDYLSESVVLRREIADAGEDELQAELDLIQAIQAIAKTTSEIGGSMALAMAYEMELGALEMTQELREQNPDSLQLGHIVVLAYHRLSKLAMAKDEIRQASVALVGCYKVLQNLIAAGHQLDPELLTLYNELEAMREEDTP